MSRKEKPKPNGSGAVASGDKLDIKVQYENCTEYYTPDYRVRMPDGRIYSITTNIGGDPLISTAFQKLLNRLFAEVEHVYDLHNSSLTDDEHEDLHFVSLAEWLKELLFRYKHPGVSIALGPGNLRHVIIGDGDAIENTKETSMSERYVYLDNNHDPAVPHYFADYEGLVAFLLADRLRQSDRHEVILIRYDGCNWISTAKHTEFYTAGRWFDAHILDPDVSEADADILEMYRYYGYDQLDQLLDSRRIQCLEGNTPHLHAIDDVIRMIAETLPGAYDRQHIPGTMIPAEANFAILEDDHIRFESFDCEPLMRLHKDAAEYDHTRAEIRAHWNKLIHQRRLPSDKPTYESGDTWIG